MKPEVFVLSIVVCALAVAVLYWQLRKSSSSGNFRLPQGVEIVAGPSGPVFRGTATALFPAITELLRGMARKPVGSSVKVGKFVLSSSNEIPAIPDPKVVVLPPHAWNIVASKFAEVATGWEQSPFYFGDCGCLSPRPEPDVGVELVGTPLEDRESH